jgi:hypothetical protein
VTTLTNEHASAMKLEAVVCRHLFAVAGASSPRIFLRICLPRYSAPPTRKIGPSPQSFHVFSNTTSREQLD